MRSSWTFRANVAACSGVSPWVTPTSTSRPGPISATTAPATVTLAEDTRCTTARMARHPAGPPPAQRTAGLPAAGRGTLVVGVAGRFELERGVGDVEVAGQAACQPVKHRT